MKAMQLAVTLLLPFTAWSEGVLHKYMMEPESESTPAEKPKEAHVEAWYINVAGATGRAKCMEAQLKNIGVEPHRYEAMKTLTPDCTAGGEKKAFMTDYDEQSKVLTKNDETRFHVISNWCSHKKLMDRFYNSNSTADFMIMLEDDAVIDEKNYKMRLNQFINEYQGEFHDNWQMVQLDFYGSSCRAHDVGHVGGKTVFKPRQLYKQAPGMLKPLKGSQECAQYFGGQGLLVRRSAIPEIIQNMETHQTVPLDWLPAQLPRGLAWKSGIVWNSRSYKTTKGFQKACGNAHFTSNIAGGKGVPASLLNLEVAKQPLLQKKGKARQHFKQVADQADKEKKTHQIA